MSKKTNRVIEHEVKGGIIPHHLLPSFILSDFFLRLPKTTSTIILLGPNHYERGNYKSLTSAYSWQTPFGLVEPDLSILDDLVKSKLVQIDESTLEKEHSVSGIMPYIKYYLPNSKVVPVIFKRSQSIEDLEQFSEKLTVLSKQPNTITIAAVDFSHYLPSLYAKEKNKETLKAMKDFDYAELMSFNNSNTDSPPCLVALLMTMKKLGRTDFNILSDTNSGEILDETSQVTSYFSIIF